MGFTGVSAVITESVFYNKFPQSVVASPQTLPIVEGVATTLTTTHTPPMKPADKIKMQKTADDFAAAFAACNSAKTREAFKAAEPELDKALIAYRKVHGISDAFGLMDCINHYNRTYANA